MTLRLRPEQLSALSSQVDAGFTQRMASFLRTEFQDASASCSDELDRFVRQAILRAKSFGLLAEDHVATYVITAWLLGPDFVEAYPPAASMLKNASCSPNTKAEWLAHWTVGLYEQST